MEERGARQAQDGADEEEQEDQLVRHVDVLKHGRELRHELDLGLGS